MNFVQKIAFNLVKNQVSDYIQSFLSGEDVGGGNSIQHIDSETAMKYSAVFACVRVLSETFASAPIMLYRKTGDGDRKLANDISIYDVLHNAPNEEMSPFNYKEMSMIALNLGGNCVSQKLKNRMGEIVQLYPLDWQKLKIERDLITKKLIYKVKDGTSDKELTKDKVFHVPGLSFDGIVGVSPISYASAAIQLGLSYEKFGVNFYRNGANASGAFSTAGELGEEAYKRLKKELAANYTGLKNTGKPLLLEGGLEFKPFTINPADAQLIENKRFQTEDICRIYRVPLHLVQELSRSTNNNIEHQSLEFVMYTMLPWFKRYEDNANMQLLTPEQRKAGYFLEFKIDSLLRGDAKSRSEAYAQGRQWGWLSVNDIRKLENMNPIPNGDIYLEPTNMHEAGRNDNIKALSEEIYKMINERK